MYRYSGSRQPERISISACPPVQADSADSADVAAIAGSVWVASATASTMSAIGLGRASTGHGGTSTLWVSGIGSPSDVGHVLRRLGAASRASALLIIRSELGLGLGFAAHPVRGDGGDEAAVKRPQRHLDAGFAVAPVSEQGQ